MTYQQSSLKVCAGASAGGHMNELLQLLNYTESWPAQPSFYLTTMDIMSKKLSIRGTTYIIGECNRHQPFRAFITLIRCIQISFKERPDVIITTGAMPMALFCIVSKFIAGTRIIWIDSIANVEHLSMSGRLIKRFADLFLTQWPELAENDEKIDYAGAIF